MNTTLTITEAALGLTLTELASCVSFSLDCSKKINILNNSPVWMDRNPATWINAVRKSLDTDTDSADSESSLERSQTLISPHKTSDSWLLGHCGP